MLALTGLATAAAGSGAPCTSESSQWGQLVWSSLAVRSGKGHRLSWWWPWGPKGRKGGRKGTKGPQTGQNGRRRLCCRLCPQRCNLSMRDWSMFSSDAHCSSACWVCLFSSCNRCATDLKKKRLHRLRRSALMQYMMRMSWKALSPEILDTPSHRIHDY